MVNGLHGMMYKEGSKRSKNYYKRHYMLLLVPLLVIGGNIH